MRERIEFQFVDVSVISFICFLEIRFESLQTDAYRDTRMRCLNGGISMAIVLNGYYFEIENVECVTRTG